MTDPTQNNPDPCGARRTGATARTGSAARTEHWRASRQCHRPCSRDRRPSGCGWWTSSTWRPCRPSRTGSRNCRGRRRASATPTGGWSPSPAARTGSATSWAGRTTTLEACTVSNYAAAAMAAADGQEVPVKYVCHAHLTQFAATIRLNNRTLGTIVLGDLPEKRLSRRRSRTWPAPPASTRMNSRRPPTNCRSSPSRRCATPSPSCNSSPTP